MTAIRYFHCLRIFRRPDYFVPFAALLVSLGFTGCESPEKRIGREIPKVRAEWEAQVREQRQRLPQPLSWPGAVAVLRQKNLQLRATRLEITNAQEEVRQVFRDLRPSLNLDSGVTKSLRNFSALSADDVTFNANGLINLQGVVNLNSRLYGARLTLLRAEIAYALAERTQIIDLYKLFLRGQDQLDSEAELASRRQLAVTLSTADEWAGRRLQGELEGQSSVLTREREELSQKIGDLLGDRSRQWQLNTNGLPTLDYHGYVFRETNQIGRLQMRLAAIELEGMRARLRGIKLQYWPELTFYMFGPPIFQRYFGQTVYWDPSDIQASANLFWSIDTRGYISRQLHQTQRDQELQLERLRQESRAQIDKFLAAQAALTEADQELARIDTSLAMYGHLPPIRDYLEWDQAMSHYRSLVDRKKNLRQQTAELQTLFWFVDDDKWNQN